SNLKVQSLATVSSQESQSALGMKINATNTSPNLMIGKMGPSCLAFLPQTHDHGLTTKQILNKSKFNDMLLDQKSRVLSKSS
ncbi:hypothetical protein AB9E09_35120, partial [Rhizobium leguminosarum]|uniref:hypothetical protein n=1 Tax=Rhizobium leguminosarum TaxID=384 RepID=UPI003F951B51